MHVIVQLVIHISASSCNPGRPTQLNDVTSGYIVANSNRSCQTRLTALQGQAIKLTFINFHSKQTAAIPSNQCFNYVKIIDDARSVSDAGGSEQVTNKCAVPVLDQQASSSRVYPSFVSKSHDIRLTVQYSATQDIGHLLMYYEGTNIFCYELYFEHNRVFLVTSSVIVSNINVLTFDLA